MRSFFSMALSAGLVVSVTAAVFMLARRLFRQRPNAHAPQTPAFRMIAASLLAVAVLCAMVIPDSPYLGCLAETALGSAAESGVAATAPTEADLLPPGKVLRIGDWIYYAPAYTLYRMKADGSDHETLFEIKATRLYNNGAHHLVQCGDYLLFTHAAYIYKMDLNTLETTELLKAENTLFTFAVSGHTVYFIGIEGDYQDGVYQIDIDGTGLKQIASSIRGWHCQMQLYKDQIYVSQDNGNLRRVNLGDSSVREIPNSLDINVVDFIVYEDHIFGRSAIGILFRSDLQGGHCIPISEDCSSFTIAGGKMIYSEKSGGIFLCDLDGGNQKVVYQSFADIWGVRENKMLITSAEEGPQLKEIAILGDKGSMPKIGNAWAGSTVARVASADEFNAAVVSEHIETIQVTSSITLKGRYQCTAARNKHALIIDQGAALTIEASNFLLTGCNVITHGELIVTGSILSQEEILFTGDGKISCIGRGAIECVFPEAMPTTQALNRLLSQNSPYTYVCLISSKRDEPELVLTEDLEISKGKTLKIFDYLLTVPKGVTLTNNGTLSVLRLNVEGTYEGQPRSL